MYFEEQYDGVRAILESGINIGVRFVVFEKNEGEKTDAIFSIYGKNGIIP